MTQTLELAKGTALAKTSRQVKEMAKRIERARQRFNERHARAESEFMEEIRAAVMENIGETETTEPIPVVADTMVNGS